MSARLDQFNSVAKYYDRLARLVFGKSLIRAQTFFLQEIPPQSFVLIMGGGTGWLLKQLMQVNPSCRVWYVEASSAMIAMAKKSLPHKYNDQVVFIHGTERFVPPAIQFDVVITNFFLDLFEGDTLAVVIQKLNKQLKSGGMWLASDFVCKRTWWQRPLLKIMYLFFSISCGIEAKRLPLWEQSLTAQDLLEVNSKAFFHTFIKSSLYLKKSS